MQVTESFILNVWQITKFSYISAVKMTIKCKTLPGNGDAQEKFLAFRKGFTTVS